MKSLLLILTIITCGTAQAGGGGTQPGVIMASALSSETIERKLIDPEIINESLLAKMTQLATMEVSQWEQPMASATKAVYGDMIFAGGGGVQPGIVQSVAYAGQAPKAQIQFMDAYTDGSIAYQVTVDGMAYQFEANEQVLEKVSPKLLNALEASFNKGNVNVTVPTDAILQNWAL